MLSGALWAKASSALTDLKDNISNALENLDKAGEGDEAQSEDNEVEAYKALLEEAQILQVELSKQSSVVIAQKEAEIAHWKKIAEQNGAVVPPDSSAANSALTLEKLKAENEMLESSVSQLEEQLKMLLKPVNDSKALEKKLFLIERKYEACKNDLIALRRDMELREKAKSETIDNLVLEYSKLAAESEQRQMQDAQIIKALEKKKYLYETKIAAMEHSLTEFADRASVATTSKDSSDGSTHGASASDSKSQTKIDALSGLLEASKQANSALSKKLKEKEDEIIKLTADNCNDGSTVAAKLKSLLDSKEQDLKYAQEQNAELERELQKSKDIAKQAVGVVASVKAELAEANTELAALKSTGSGASSVESDVKTNAELETSYKSRIADFEVKLTEKQVELDAVFQSLQDLQSKHTSEVEILTKQVAETMTMKEKFESEISALKATINDLTTASGEAHGVSALKIEELRIQLEKAQRNEATANDKVQELTNQLQAHVLTSQSGESEAVKLITSQMQSLIDAEKTALAALREEKIKTESDLRQMLVSLETSLADANAAHEATLAAEISRGELAVATAVAAEQARADDLVAEERTKASALVASLQSEHEAAVKELNVRHDATVAELKEAHEAAMHAERSTHNALLLEEQGKFAEILAEEKARHESLVAGLEAKHLALLEEERNKHAAAVAELQHTMEASLQTIKAAHGDEVASLMANHSSALAQAIASNEAALAEERTNSAAAIAEERARSEALQKEEAARAAAELAAEQKRALAHLESTLAATKAEAEALRVQSLDDQRNELVTLKTLELNQLRQQCDNEKIEALGQLETQKSAELERLRSDLTAEIARLNQDLEAKQHELASARAQFDAELASALTELGVQKDKEQELALAAMKADCDAVVANYKAERDEFQQMYLKESKLRKTIHNKLLEIQGNIRVICRVRPVLDVERRAGEGVDVTEFPPSGEELVVQRDAQSKTRFEFDRVFAQLSEQEQVFESVGPLCVSALDGYNVCIFAYGQTGSGKTFTMEGSLDKPGVSPRAISQLFAVAGEREDSWRFAFTFSMLEIYNESILDLLDRNKDKEKLDIRQTPEGNIVQGLTEVAVTTPQQVAELMAQGQANRAVGAHDMNEHSSRSHSILTIVCRGKNKLDGSTSFGKLHLIDLAGSERVSKTDATGDRLKEAQNINKSLSALGDVISALGNKKATHVPYRNSKLTFLLQDSLGGNSKVLMFVNVSPAIYNLGETLCSLNFATRCRNVELGQAKRQITSGSSSASSPSPSLDDSGAGAAAGGGAGSSATINTSGIAGTSGKEPVSPKPLTTPLVKRTSTTTMSTLRK